MDDALELSVNDNEFDTEFDQTDKLNSKSESKVTKPAPAIYFEPDNYISLKEAKEKLLQSLDQYDLKDDVMLCARGSVKSRLGVRVEGVEFMDCSDSNDLAAQGQEYLGSETTNDSPQYEYRANKTSQCSLDNVPRRPSMKNLCKRLRVRWYDNPVKIGKEIAERLEEHKFSLIIETVKVIGGKNTLALFNETKRIQLKGGMKTCNGMRRRTSGGVFFTLLKSSNYATEEQVKEIFKEDLSMRKDSIKRKKAAYNKRKKEKLQLQKEQEASANNAGQQTDNNMQPSSNIAQPMSIALQPANNNLQLDSHTLQPPSNTLQPPSNTFASQNSQCSTQT